MSFSVLIIYVYIHKTLKNVQEKKGLVYPVKMSIQYILDKSYS